MSSVKLWIFRLGLNVLKLTHQYGRNNPCPGWYYISTFGPHVLHYLHGQTSLWCPLANLWQYIAGMLLKFYIGYAYLIIYIYI